MAKDSEPAPPFKSGHRLALLICVLLTGVTLVDILTAHSYYSEAKLYWSGFPEPEESGMAYLLERLILGSLYGLLQLPAAILFLVWVHRVYRNLAALGAQNLTYSPGWAVGGFLVPLLNLVRPFFVVSEIWKASRPDLRDGDAWQATRTSPLIAVWWFGWLAAVTSSLIVYARPARHPMWVRWDVIAVETADIAAAVLAMVVIWQIDKRQSEKRQRRMSG